jgi:hypothetical protein
MYLLWYLLPSSYINTRAESKYVGRLSLQPSEFAVETLFRFVDPLSAELAYFRYLLACG